MRRAAAVVLGTITGTSLLVGAKLGTSGADPAASDDAGATAVVVGGPGGAALPTAHGRSPGGGTPTPRPTGARGTPTAKPTATGKPTPKPSPSPTHSGPADGSYTASAPVNRGHYGTLSMTVTVSGHRITNIAASETDPTESRCYHGACPTLTSEALAAQSTHINSVSGATYTSAAYRSALQAILDSAGG